MRIGTRRCIMAAAAVATLAPSSSSSSSSSPPAVTLGVTDHSDGDSVPSLAALAEAVSTQNAELVRLRADLEAALVSRGSRVATVRSFGAACDGIQNDTTAFQAAVDGTEPGGLLTLPVGRCWLPAPVYIRDKAISIRGEGAGSVLTGDADVIVGINASNSELSDFSVEIWTPPWSFDLFDENNDFLPLAGVLKTLNKSTAGQFSYTVNFPSKCPGLDKALTAEQKQIGQRVRVLFSGSNHVTIRGLRGMWLSVTISDGSYCQITGCDIKGGNDVLGTIVIVSGDSGFNWGLHNRVTQNTIRNGGNSGVVLLRQKYAQLLGNSVIQVGESGLKTWQGNCCGPNSPSRRCYHVSAVGNTIISSVYDGIDFNADYGTASERVGDFVLAIYPWYCDI
jgi:hypothetical protein